MLTLTAPIGQAVLRNAIRLKDNYIETGEKVVLDREASGCRKCIGKRYPELCERCHTKVYTADKTYVNEKARYGYKKPLKQNAILFLIWLHFCAPDESGLVRFIDTEDAAKDIGCHRKTVENNIKTLEETGYISARKLELPGYYDVFLLDYKHYFKKANEGGRGYVTFTKEIFAELKHQINLNALRLTIRSLLYTMENIKENGVIPEKPYKEIKRDLPEYVTKSQIRDIVHSDAFQKLFTVSDQKKYTISLKIKDAFSLVGTKDALIQDCKSSINNFIQETNKKKKKEKKINLTDKELKDLSNIGTQYPVQIVVASLRQVYETYFLNNKTIGNIGALVRMYAKRNTQAYALGL